MLDLQTSIALKTFTRKEILPMKQELQFPVVNQTAYDLKNSGGRGTLYARNSQQSSSQANMAESKPQTPINKARYRHNVQEEEVSFANQGTQAIFINEDQYDSDLFFDNSMHQIQSHQVLKKSNHLLGYRGAQDHVLKAYQDFSNDSY